MSLLAAATNATPDVNFKSIGQFTLKNAAFPTVTQFDDGSDKFLLVSSFGALSSGAVYVVPNITQAIVAGNVSGLKPV